MNLQDREATLNSKQVKFLLSGALIVVATLVWFVFVAGGAATSVAAYDISLAEFQRLSASSRDEDVRVRGTVEEGSIVQRPGSAEVAFLIVDGADTLKVRYSSRDHGALPDTFVDGAAAIVTGSLDEAGVFQAHTIQAKCPSKYEGAQGEMEARGVRPAGPGAAYGTKPAAPGAAYGAKSPAPAGQAAGPAAGQAGSPATATPPAPDGKSTL